MQQVITGLIVLLAAGFLGRRLMRALRGRPGCVGCGAADGCTASAQGTDDDARPEGIPRKGLPV